MLAGPNLSATFGSSESMETTTDEPQAIPEKNMRSADDAPSVESEDETNAITSGPDSGGKKSHAKRSEEARVRRKATLPRPPLPGIVLTLVLKCYEKAITSIRGIHNMTETDGGQEAEEVE